MPSSTKTVRLTVIAADGLVKKDLFFKMPDPFGKCFNFFMSVIKEYRATCLTCLFVTIFLN